MTLHLVQNEKTAPKKQRPPMRCNFSILQFVGQSFLSNFDLYSRYGLHCSLVVGPLVPSAPISFCAENSFLVYLLGLSVCAPANATAHLGRAFRGVVGFAEDSTSLSSWM